MKNLYWKINDKYGIKIAVVCLLVGLIVASLK